MPRWTDESRRKHAEAMKQWKPWEQSTGPKSAAGKEKSKMNALKHGWYSQWGAAIRAIFHHNCEFRRHFAFYMAAERALKERDRQRAKARETNYTETKQNQRDS